MMELIVVLLYFVGGMSIVTALVALSDGDVPYAVVMFGLSVIVLSCATELVMSDWCIVDASLTCLECLP